MCVALFTDARFCIENNRPDGPWQFPGALVEWDSKQINSAKIGSVAPDFQLANLSGTNYRLSDFRGKQAVVLVFIYGDT